MFFSEHVMYSITFLNLTGEYPEQSYRYYSVHNAKKKCFKNFVVRVIFSRDQELKMQNFLCILKR